MAHGAPEDLDHVCRPGTDAVDSPNSKGADGTGRFLASIRVEITTSFMRPHHPTLPERILTLLAGVLILKVTGSVISNYGDYLPPNFQSDFLHGREHSFFGVYEWAFYTHIFSGPVSLILGLVLVSERFRSHFPRWHRYLGRLQVACVLLLVTPSGLAMASHTAAGPIAAASLATLAIATAACISLGTRSAMRGRFVDHRRWMWRCYLLLCSAVVLRLIGGLATVAELNAPWIDPLATWMSWVIPITAFELRERARGKSGPVERDRPRNQAAHPQRDMLVH